MTEPPRQIAFSGAVLAGGRSSRFGQDKARYVYRGKPLAAWVLESLADADERFIVADRPYAFGVPVLPDQYPGSSLGGLHAALLHAAHDWVALAACDQPFLTPDYWQQLITYIGSPRISSPYAEVQAVVATGPEGRLQPLCALYHRSLQPLAEAQLETGTFKIQQFIAQIRARIVPWDALDVSPQTFFNANRRSDLP